MCDKWIWGFVANTIRTVPEIMSMKDMSPIKISHMILGQY